MKGRPGRAGRTGRARRAASARRAEALGADTRAGIVRGSRSTVAAPRERRAGQPFIVITGLSGSGKSQAIRALEDLGYFCVDNLPTTLIPTLAKLSLRAGRDIDKVAIVVDVSSWSR